MQISITEKLEFHPPFPAIKHIRLLGSPDRLSAGPSVFERRDGDGGRFSGERGGKKKNESGYGIN
jgi:hypothetical protein